MKLKPARREVKRRESVHPYTSPTSERRGSNSNGLEKCYLQAKTRVWPDLSCMLAWYRGRTKMKLKPARREVKRRESVQIASGSARSCVAD